MNPHAGWYAECVPERCARSALDGGHKLLPSQLWEDDNPETFRQFWWKWPESSTAVYLPCSSAPGDCARMTGKPETDPLSRGRWALTLTGDDAGDGGFKNFAGEDGAGGLPGSLAVYGRGLAEHDDVFDLRRVHGTFQDSGAEFLFADPLQSKAPAVRLGEIEIVHLGQHARGLAGDFRAVGRIHARAGKRQLDAEDIVQVAVCRKPDGGCHDQYVGPLRGGFNQRIEFG